VAEGWLGAGGLDLSGDQRRLVDLVHGKLKDAIQEGLVRPGERLAQGELAKQFGTSRSPIREAIVRLSEEGFVTIEPHRGAFVREFTELEMHHLYEVRSLLEPYAAEKAARQASQDDLDRLAAVHARAEAHGGEMDVKTLFRFNGEFHRLLVAPCANDTLLSTLDSLWNRQVAFGMFAIYTQTQGAVDAMLREHGEILDAYREKRADVVRALVDEHIRESWRTVSPSGAGPATTLPGPRRRVGS